MFSSVISARLVGGSPSPLAMRSSAIARRVRWASTTASPSSARVVGYDTFGVPEEVLSLRDQALPAKLGDSHVLVKMLAAPINPADLNMVEGTYGVKVPLPAVGGNEGVGVVVNVGSGVQKLKVDDRVILTKPGKGTWRTFGVFDSGDLHPVSSTLEIPYAATLSVNPSTAYRLLEDFEKLQENDVVIQNGGNSMVGQAVIQLAKRKKVKTISIIRGRQDFDDVVDRMKTLGGGIVVTEEYVRSPQFRRLLSDMPKPKLALNCVGGSSATEMARVLGENGTLVTYGGMSRKPITIPTSLLIFKNIQLKGFWITKWLEQHPGEETTKMLDHLSQLIEAGQLKLWMEAWDFNKFDDALKKTRQAQRDRKVVLTMP